MKKKKLIALAFLLAMGGVQSFAENQIDFNVKPIDDTTTEGPGYGKAPLRRPTVWQDDYQLDFNGTHAEYVLNIVDGEEVVYSTIVYSDETVVFLPTWLKDEFEIQLVQGRYMFVGIINL